MSGLVLMVRCWTVYYVHKSPPNAGSVSVFLYMLYSEDHNMHFHWQHGSYSILESEEGPSKGFLRV